MYEELAQLASKLRNTVLTRSGDSDTALRRAVESWAESLGRSQGAPPNDVPEELRRYVEKVACHAYKVTDGDIQKLGAADYSEDAIFEITVNAAVGAGMVRLERGLAAIREQHAEHEKEANHETVQS